MEQLKGERLIIRADASTEIGTGHLMRCLALAQAWTDAGGKVTFVTACQNQSLLRRLHAEGFDIHILAQPYPDPADWDYTKNILATFSGAWVVLDGYHFDEIYQQRIKEAGHRLMVIDDMVHFKHYYADIVFNQNLHAENLQYPCEPYTRLLLGTQYLLLRREFLAWKDWQRKIPEVAQRVLVTLGGSDPDNVTLKAMQALQQVGLPGLEATIVIGASNPHAEVLEVAARQSPITIRLIRDAGNMPELMAQADAAISGGGATCWELEYMGVPMLVTVLALNQEANARVLQKKGIALTLGLEHAHDSGKMSQLIQELLDNKQARTAMSRMGKTVVDGQGPQRVLASLVEQARTVIQVDDKADFTNPLGGSQQKEPLFKVVFLGGKQAGFIGLLTAIASGCKIQGVVASDSIVETLAAELGLPVFASVKQPEVEKLLADSDLLVSVHSREIVPEKLLALPRLGGINVHPCLYRYKGSNPIGRLLRDGCTQASVGIHRMTERVDEGEVLAEEFVNVAGKRSVDEVYNVLYPFYAFVLLKALKVLETSDILTQ